LWGVEYKADLADMAQASEVPPSPSSLNLSTRFNLGDGTSMPALGFGTYQINDDDVVAAVETALKLGYRHIDTAQAYENEVGVGKGLVASGVDTSEVFITTKLWPGNPDWGMPSKSYDETIAATKASVEKLGVDSVDLYLIHAPFGGAEARLAMYRAMVTCQKEGLVKSIGVSNYGIAHLQELEQAELPLPAVNQLELHPTNQKSELLAYMVERNILPIAYSSLAPLSNWREGQQSSKDDASREGPSLVAGVAEGTGRSEAQVLLRYALQKGWCILPKSIREERIAQNMDVFSFELSDEQMSELDGMEKDESLAWPNGMDPTKAE